MSDYQFRAYCDICNAGSQWVDDGESNAREWRRQHFIDTHPDNAMVKDNCRIQRRANG